MSLIQKDVPADTVDAMKRTISSMLGLLPSDRFNVLVEAFWDPLFKLLVSSMVTGYMFFSVVVLLAVIFPSSLGSFNSDVEVRLWGIIPDCLYELQVHIAQC